MNEENTTQMMTPEMRYYYRNREEKLAKDLARYHSNPEVIVKREERERKRIEKEAEKEAKRLEKERIRQEKLALAETSKRKLKEKSGSALNAFLVGSPPVGINS